jgi:hypothetical protein
MLSLGKKVCETLYQKKKMWAWGWHLLSQLQAGSIGSLWPWQKVRPYLRNNQRNKGLKVWPSKCEAVNSNPSMDKGGKKANNMVKR